ncbi:hypothetical protein [Prosthecobacter fusiformis]|nr:hypothetical protein [Prosthecobacter fusiformis]
MSEATSFPYQPKSGEGNGVLPFCPVLLISSVSVIMADGLLDSGATVSVLPHSVGITLGFRWDQDLPSVSLGGNLARFEARLIRLSIAIPGFSPHPMSFAWSKSDNIPVILGQMNFFQFYDVTFHGSQRSFEIQTASNLPF